MQIKKNDKVNLEKKKFLFFEIGLILSLAICLVAFEWSTKELTTTSLGDINLVEMLEEDILTTEQDAPPEDIIEPEEIEPETVIEELVIVEDDTDVKDVDFSTESTEKTEIEVKVKPTIIEEPEEEVEPINFAIVEEKPEFPGGDAALLKFVAENTKYPEIAKENGATGTVYVQFVIDKDGKVTKVSIAKSAQDPHLDAEGTRVVKLIPKWKPGKQRGKSVPVTYLIPIKFNLQ